MMNYEMMLLHEAIRLLLISIRQQRQHTQQSLSIESGISRQFISQMECGKRIPSIDTLFVLSNALETSITALMAELDMIYQRLFWQRQAVQSEKNIQRNDSRAADNFSSCLEYIRKTGGGTRL